MNIQFSVHEAIHEMATQSEGILKRVFRHTTSNLLKFYRAAMAATVETPHTHSSLKLPPLHCFE